MQLCVVRLGSRTLRSAIGSRSPHPDLEAVMSTWSELGAFARVRKQRPLLPLMPLLGLVGPLLLLAHGSVPASFISTIS
jgi:hypothetical protein